MYHTKGFWGLESNRNANTLNNTLNAVSSPSFTIIVIVIFAVVLLVLMSTVRMGF